MKTKKKKNIPPRVDIMHNYIKRLTHAQFFCKKHKVQYTAHAHPVSCYEEKKVNKKDDIHVQL